MLLYMLLAITLVISVGIGVHNYRLWGSVDIVDWLLPGALSALIGTIVSFVVAFLTFGPQPANHFDRDESALKALGTNETLGGHFFLASGSFSKSSTYKFMKGTDDGGFFMDEVSISAATIYEGNDTDPYMVEIEHIVYYPDIVPWSFSVGSTYEFHIPENSVVETYAVDVND